MSQVTDALRSLPKTLSPYTEHGDDVAKQVFRAFVRVEFAPETSSGFEYINVMSRITGSPVAKSRKISNVILNWRQLLTKAPEIVTAIGSLDFKILGMFAGLQIVGALVGLASIEITMDHAVAMAAMWESGQWARVEESDACTVVNDYRITLTKPTLTKHEFAKIVTELAKLRAVALEDGKITLIERCSLNGASLI